MSEDVLSLNDKITWIELHSPRLTCMVDVSTGLKIPEMEIVEAFKVNLLVEYNGNRILAAVNGSFIVIRNGERVANIHVIPANTCRNHKCVHHLR